jgi:hypothetical protein
MLDVGLKLLLLFRQLAPFNDVLSAKVSLSPPFWGFNETRKKKQKRKKHERKKNCETKHKFEPKLRQQHKSKNLNRKQTFS